MTSMRLGELGQIALTVRNLSLAVPFYRDVLGLPHLFDAPPALSFFACGAIRLMLSEPESGASFTPHNSVLYFRVANIQEAHSALTGRGAKFEREPHLLAKLPDHDLWMAFLRDPDGNLLGLMSEVKH